MPLRFYTHIRRNAISRSFVFDVSMEYLWKLFESQGGRCALTGTQLSMPGRARLRSAHTASLDRIDNSKGYVADNVRWVHKAVNVMRMDMSDEEFIAWCSLVVRHNSAG
jgi:hypothetical protein